MSGDVALAASLEAVTGVVRSVPTFIVLSLTPPKARDVMLLSSCLHSASILLEGYDDVTHHLDDLDARETAPQGYAQILAPLHDALAPALSDVVTAAVLSGRKRLPVRELAHRCAMSRRALELKLRINGGPVPRELLGWVRSLHVLWRLDVLGCSPKQAAVVAGFHSSDAMAMHVYRWTGYRPRAVVAAGGFDCLLRECVQRWRTER